VTADSVQGRQSGSWSGDELSQQLQHLGLRIVKVEPDGAAAVGISGVHPTLSSTEAGWSAAAPDSLQCLHSSGNCLFRALGDQLFGSDGDHARLRREVLDYVQVSMAQALTTV
jgi:hypothetical protein